MDNHFQPTEKQNRIELLDVLRGFSIAGVLIVNILYFSGFFYTPFEDLEKLSLPSLNTSLINIMFTVLLGKFYPILSILFGAGIYMQFQKSKNPGFLGFFIKRMFFLMIIGAIHMSFWPGDVVFIYALFSLLLIPFRNSKPKTYLIFAILMLVCNFVVIYMQSIWGSAKEQIEYTAYLHLADILPNDLIDTVKNDGFAGFIVLIKAHFSILWTLERYASLSFRVLLLFMVGAYLYGSGFITEKAHKYKYFFIFLGLGIASSLLMYYVSWHLRIFDNLLLGIAYISLVKLLMNKSKKARKALLALAPLGRMALTNYIMQSIIGITIFYGIGFGLYGQLPLYQVLIIAIIILIFQIQFSKYWLKKHDFGPLEWIWRRLSYGKYFKKNNLIIHFRFNIEHN